MTKLMGLQSGRFWHLFSPTFSWDITKRGWIRNYNYDGLLYYKRYIETKDHAVSFYNCINRQHSNIKFTTETEEAGKLPFLDVLMCNKPNLVKFYTF